MDTKIVVFKLSDKDNNVIQTYTLPHRIIIKRSKFFDNCFEQFEFTYSYPNLDNETLIEMFDVLFFGHDKIQVNDLTKLRMINEIYDYFLVQYDLSQLIDINNIKFDGKCKLQDLVDFGRKFPEIYFDKFHNTFVRNIDAYNDFVRICIGNTKYLRHTSPYVFINGMNKDKFRNYLDDNKIKELEQFYSNNDCLCRNIVMNWNPKDKNDYFLDKIRNCTKNHHSMRKHNYKSKIFKKYNSQEIKNIIESEYDKYIILINCELSFCDGSDCKSWLCDLCDILKDEDLLLLTKKYIYSKKTELKRRPITDFSQIPNFKKRYEEAEIADRKPLSNLFDLIDEVKLADNCSSDIEDGFTKFFMGEKSDSSSSGSESDDSDKVKNVKQIIIKKRRANDSSSSDSDDSDKVENVKQIGIKKRKTDDSGSSGPDSDDSSSSDEEETFANKMLRYCS